MHSEAPPPEPPSADDADLLRSQVERLTLEHDAAESVEAKAILLHEIAVLQQRLGDDTAAAREELSAVNAQARFYDPLERLIGIIERRRSYKNLGKLLERLVRVAPGPIERGRAQVAYASHLITYDKDYAQARAVLQQAVVDDEDNAPAWLLLEIVAGHTNDDALRNRALAARARLAEHPWQKNLLSIDHATSVAETGDLESAVSTLTQTLDRGGPGTFAALSALEDLGKRHDRTDVQARALQGQAELLAKALADAAIADLFSIPRYRCTKAAAAEVWLRAAEATRKLGDTPQAVRLLDRALTELPDDPVLIHARINAAESAGDTETAAKLARVQLRAGCEGTVAAALQLRVAEAEAAENRIDEALRALERALVADPACIPARSLQLDLLGRTQSHAALSQALRDCALELPSEDAKARFFIASAEVSACLAGDPVTARQALTSAETLGTDRSLLARTARLLASLCGDQAWYEQATTRLLASAAGSAVAKDVCLELLRGQLSRGDRTGVLESLRTLAATPDGGWLSHAISSYVLPVYGSPEHEDAAPRSGRSADSAEALSALSEVESNPTLARALRLIMALRQLSAKRTDDALLTLRSLHESDTTDLTVAVALSELERARDRKKPAGEVLEACASTVDDPKLAVALRLEAAILLWQSGDRQASIERFADAHAIDPEASAALYSWALRAATPDDPEARRRALIASQNGSPLANVERFGLEAGAEGDREQAALAIANIPSDPSSDFFVSKMLAQALLAEPGSDAERTALGQIEELSEPARVLARAARYSSLLAQGRRGSEADPTQLEAAAADWAEVDSSLSAALEWFGASLKLGDIEREVLARRAIAERLPARHAGSLLSSASLIEKLRGTAAPPLVPGTDPQLCLTNLETSPPGCDPRRRAQALLGLGGSLGESSAILATVLAAENQLATGQAEQALQSFRQVVAAMPDDLIGWEGLRKAAYAVNDHQAAAEACGALADVLSDRSQGARLWEEAAFLYINELKDPERGEFALSRAVEFDVGRAAAFDRLFRIVRARKDGQRLLELIAARLEVAEDPEEIAKMFWERARVLREQGDVSGALVALDNVTMLEPDHVGALALSSEIFITQKHYESAATNLARLAGLTSAPQKQRLVSGVAAVDLFENKLNDSAAALQVLLDLYDGGLSTPPVRERLARIASKQGEWERATTVLGELMRERSEPQGRVEAARLQMTILRDQLNRPAAALDAVTTLLEIVPGDPEALQFVLSGAFEQRRTEQFLAKGQAALIRGLSKDPLHLEQVTLLSQIASRLDNAALRQASLGAIVALGGGTAEIDRELERLDQRVAHLPHMVIDKSNLPTLADPEDAGPVSELFELLGPTIADAIGPGLQAFAVTRKQRISPREGLPLRNEIAAWVGALGLEEFDLYVGGEDPEGVFGVGSETPAIVVGKRVASPLSPQHRQRLARELFALRRGTTVLRHRDASEVAALIVAACQCVGVQVAAPQYAMLSEFQRLLGRAMSRRARKALPPVAMQIADSKADLIKWYRGATSSLDRLAAIAAGDVSWVLADSAADRGRLGESLQARERVARLLAFVLSPAYLDLRKQLGMGVQ